MMSLSSLFRSRYFAVGAGFALLISLAFTLGAWLGWSMMTRLYIVIGILVLSVIVVLVELVRSQRSASKMEDSMRWQAEQQVQSSRPDKQREIEEMQQRFEDAVERLKRSKLGGGKRGNAALHALPWYLFIGPPSSGKTTAIVNSGLNFPIGTDRVQGVGGTRNCDWFFSDQAIILDTAGRYVRDTEDEKEWHTFLDMLKENRPGRPVNGVVVAISVADLLDADAYDVEWHAITIRRRISELVDRLGVRFPVYLMFTKCDLVQGFVEFFRDLSQREREQIWGCTFDDDDDERSPRDRFEAEFDTLGAALTDIRLSRLRRSMKRETRRRVYVFPVEFAAMKETLAEFVGHLFQPNPYEAEPELRGFYFTSGTQEGRPIDRVIRNIAGRLDLPSPSNGASEEEVETKSYFLHDLFREVVIPDQYRVEQTSASARSGWLKRAGAATVGLAVLILVVIVASQAVVRSELDLQEIHTASQEAANVEWTRPNDAESLTRMASLLNVVEEFSDPEQAPSFRWGLARHDALVSSARALHYEKTKPVVQRHLQSLERRLGATSRLSVSAVGEDSLRRETYTDLRAYLLLTRDQSRLADSTERQFLEQHLYDLGSPSRWGDAESAAAYRNQIAAFVQAFASRNESPFAADERRVENVRRRLIDFASLSPYDRLRAEGMASLRPLTLEDLIPREHRALFASAPEIPGLFTIRGWTTYMETRIEEERQAPGQGDWVLGSMAQNQDASLDGNAIASEIQDAYFADYTAEWRKFLSQVQLRDATSLRQSARDLQALGDPRSSPILFFLAKVANQTDLQRVTESSALGAAVDATTERVGAADSASQAASHPVNERFSWLHALRPRQAVTDPSPQLADALSVLSEAGRAVDGVVSDPQQTTEFAASVLEADGGEFAEGIDVLNEQLYRFDAELRRELFEQPVQKAWRNVLATTQSHLNRRWREDVSRPFDVQLSRTYPFDADASVDAAILDVEKFFGPESGDLDTFLRSEIQPFYDLDRQRVRTWDGAGVVFSPETQRLFERADQLQDALFDGGVVRIALEMRPHQPERSSGAPQIPRVRMTAHGVSDTYTMGQPYWFEVVWPGRPGVSLSVDGRDGVVFEKRYDGEWALFRLLQDARVRASTKTLSQATWTHESQSGYRVSVQYDLRMYRGTELFGNPAGFFRLSVPPTLD